MVDNPIINLKNINKCYHLGERQQTVLRNINIEIHEGEMIALMGASGSGKSTLLNIIGMLDVPSQGDYFLQGLPVQKLPADKLASLRNQFVGFVFQQFFLLPRMNAVENVTLPLLYGDNNFRTARDRAQAMLERVGMLDWAAHMPNQLSGGQQQRVAIARSLITDPVLLLADEPTGALDSQTGQRVMEIFKALHAEGKTIVIVTHDEAIAKQCQRIIRIKDGSILS